MIRTKTGLHRLPFEKVKILEYIFNQSGIMQDSLEERMQGANNAWWRDVKIYRSKDAPWRIDAEECWTRSTAHFVLEAHIVLVGERSWTELKV